jgi:hypothetical protein
MPRFCVTVDQERIAAEERKNYRARLIAQCSKSGRHFDKRMSCDLLSRQWRI